jgi:phosphoribosylformylglycinamidine (FGAM) synthase-like amidotransferase family enzyme
LAGARARRVHINALIDGSVSLDDFQIMSFIGGFSWADDHGAGVSSGGAHEDQYRRPAAGFRISRGRLVIGICNGFQCLVNLGLLPGIDADYTRRSVALTFNDCGNFRDDWVDLTVNGDASPCVYSPKG